jgi:ribosomal protein S18 acetylase RimI-like enzyme
MTEIKKAEKADAKLVAEIGKLSFLESHRLSASFADIDAYVAETYTTEIVGKELSDPENIYHLIYYNQQPAGYSKINLNHPLEKVQAKNITKMDRLCLLQEFYNLRLGLKLLEFNIALSKKANQLGMWLYTWIENKRAVSFYLKAGFEIIDKAYFKISATHSNPNHLMYLKY